MAPTFYPRADQTYHSPKMMRRAAEINCNHAERPRYNLIMLLSLSAPSILTASQEDQGGANPVFTAYLGLLRSVQIQPFSYRNDAIYSTTARTVNW